MNPEECRVFFFSLSCSSASFFLLPPLRISPLCLGWVVSDSGKMSSIWISTWLPTHQNSHPNCRNPNTVDDLLHNQSVVDENQMTSTSHWYQDIDLIDTDVGLSRRVICCRSVKQGKNWLRKWHMQFDRFCKYQTIMPGEWTDRFRTWRTQIKTYYSYFQIWQMSSYANLPSIRFCRKLIINHFQICRRLGKPIFWSYICKFVVD